MGVFEKKVMWQGRSLRSVLLRHYGHGSADARLTLDLDPSYTAQSGQPVDNVFHQAAVP